jgi:hypothetical protein
MQEFPALTYKVKELHAAIQNHMSLFTDAQHVKRKFRSRARRFRQAWRREVCQATVRLTQLLESKQCAEETSLRAGAPTAVLILSLNHLPSPTPNIRCRPKPFGAGGGPANVKWTLAGHISCNRVLFVSHEAHATGPKAI